MADELLSAVIRLENKIQQQLQQEQARADAWLASVRTEQKERANQARRQLTAVDEQSLAASEQRAKQVAEALITAEMRYCCRLEQISEQVLLEVLHRHLLKVLPRKVNDHQDVQS